MKLHLIIATKDAVLFSRPYLKTESFDYDTMRDAIKQTMPNALHIYSPLDSIKESETAKRCIVLQIYLSPNKEGVGRIDSKFHLWSVLPAV